MSPMSFPMTNPICMPLVSGQVGGDVVGAADDDDFVQDIKRVAVLGDPIVGLEVIPLDEHGPGALPARALASPPAPTPAQRAAHNLTHAKYESWCPFCVSCKRPNDHHRSQPNDRLQPLLVGEYAFIRNAGDDELVPVLICRLKPHGVYFATVVPETGVHPWVAERLARFILECWLIQFSYRADREPSIVALFQEACRLSGRKGEDVTPAPKDKDASSTSSTQTFEMQPGDIPAAEEEQAPPAVKLPAVIGVPEHSHPGESQSNGFAEAAAKNVVSQARTLKAALEYNLKMSKPIPCNHPVVHWLFEHAAWVLSKFVVDAEGRTAYGRLHGREPRERICEFGEQILFYLPEKSRAKMNARWRYGIFVGRAMASDQNVIALSDGSVTRARAMTRVVPSARWNAEKIMKINATPVNEKQTSLDSIEGEENPREHAASESPDVEPNPQRATRRLKIELRDLGRFGFTRGCKKCLLHSQGRHSSAHKEHHTEACRSRIYARMKEAGVKKYLDAGQLDQERLRARTKKGDEALVDQSAPKADDVADPSAGNPSAGNLEATSDTPIAEPATAEEGIEMEDTSFLMPDLPESGDSIPVEPEDVHTHDQEAQAMHEEAYDTDMLVSQCTGMIALMENLQALGVDVVAANRFVAAILRGTLQLWRCMGGGA